MWHLPRNPKWLFELLDGEDRPLGALDGVLGGRVTVAALARLGGSGTLTIAERGQGIDWMSHRVRVTYDPGINGVEPWPIATYMLTSPTEAHDDFGTTYEVGLLPKLKIVDEPKTGLSFSIDEGEPVIDVVLDMLEALGETRVAVTPSDAVLAAPYFADPNTSYLTIINELLAGIGYWSLWVDGSGQFRVEPYKAPGERAIVYEFEAGATAIHYPDWGREQDLSSVPNVARVYREGDEDTPGIEGVAVDNDPDSPFSIPSRGFEVHRDPESAEVVDQAAADALAQRRLADAQSPVASLSVTHAVLPLNPNDAILFRPSPGVVKRATVQEMTYDLTFDGHVSAKWREV